MKFRSLSGLACLCSLCLALLACQILPTGKETMSTEQPEIILFQDDFSDPESGWQRAKTNDGLADYADGAYRILVNRQHTDIWSFPGRTFDHISVEAQVIKVGGERDNRFGLICRAVDENNFYTFLISSDGYYGIGKVRDKAFSLIGQTGLLPSPTIKLGFEFNHLRADCIGDTLTLHINGQPIFEVSDSEYTSGDVGLIAGAYDAPGTDIRFTHFKVIDR